MARHEAEREDLLAEAHALVDRAEFQVPGEEQLVVAGFRANGALSLYFGEDPALHWNSQGELRRAYAGGLLYKAEHGRLVALRRERTEDETALVRHELTAEELLAFKVELRARLQHLRSQFGLLQFKLHREVRVTAGDLATKILEMLQRVTDQLPIAASAQLL